MHRLTTLLLIFGLLFTFAGSAGAGDFEDDLRKLAEENAVGYVGPPERFPPVDSYGAGTLYLV